MSAKSAFSAPPAPTMPTKKTSSSSSSAAFGPMAILLLLTTAVLLLVAVDAFNSPEVHFLGRGHARDFVVDALARVMHAGEQADALRMLPAQQNDLLRSVE